jgi:diguanylate cyclase (GGDEF)-like protein/PAS domain S-box-containing protein
VQNEPTVRMTAVRRLYEVSARMGAGRSLAETLQAVVDGVVDGLGFGIAVLNLRQPDGKFEVIAVAGSPEAKEALLGTISAADIFDAEFKIADQWGGLRFVPHERLPEGEVIGWVPDVPVSTEPDAWHPLDALFAPLHSPEGELVGMLSVDLPEDQRRPGPIHRELLEIFATQAGLAIDKARLTDQLRAEKARLEASETTFRLVFEGAGNGMATVAFEGPDAGRVLRVNDAFCRITGYSHNQLVGTIFLDYLPNEDPGQPQRDMKMLHAGDGAYRFERTFRRTDGNDIWLGGTAVIVDQGKDLPRFVLIQIDDHFTAALQRCRQSGRRGVLLFCDLNHFKQVNDRYGHEAGDRALREIADRLQTQVRHGDTVARLGGDEFAILAEEIEGDDLDALMRRIDESIRSPLAGIDVAVTASIGTAVVSPYATDLDELLRTADHAMYEAKRQRQNT